MILDGVQGSRGNDASLSHRSAEQLAGSFGFANKVGCSGKRGADGSPEAFAETNTDTVKRGREFFFGESRRRRCVPGSIRPLP